MFGQKKIGKMPGAEQSIVTDRSVLLVSCNWPFRKVREAKEMCTYENAIEEDAGVGGSSSFTYAEFL